MTIKEKSLIRCTKMLLASGLFLTLFQSVPGFGAQQEPLMDKTSEIFPIGSTKEDLLLFWEEKDLYVETATRTDKPLTQVAENMTVITARDIHDMNAHGLAEILSRVPGLYVEYSAQEFNSYAQLYCQGSSERHVMLLLDGVVLNTLSSSNVLINTIPVQIIDRIEIIKGPASSAWGSSLGGVVNIITKGVGDRTLPRGTLSASYGEGNSQDYNAELFGKGGPLGYYLFAGKQKSDGLRNSRGFDRDSFYGKVNFTPNHDLELFFTIGYSNPDQKLGNINASGIDLNGNVNISELILNGGLNYRLTPEMNLTAAIHSHSQKSTQTTNLISPPALFQGFVWDEQTTGGSLKITYEGGIHNAVAGFDVSHGVMEQTINNGPILQSPLTPATSRVSPSITKWALFANDTLTFGKMAITPGVRFDNNNISGAMVSPSLGAAYELGEHTVFRASVARGFNYPSLGSTSGGGFLRSPNPGLTTEKVWSYQGGVETAITEYLNLKGTLFRHDMTDEINPVGNIPIRTYANTGSVTRMGYELEMETAPVYNLSLKLGHAYVHKSADSAKEGVDNYSYLVGIKYDDRKSIAAQLMGSYVWWNAPADQGAQYNTFIWDLALNKKIFITGKTTTEVFANVHNIFGGAYYTLNTYPNPGRWVEGGLRFKF